MGGVWTWDHVGRNSRDCMISLIPLGFCVIGMGVGGNVVFPVCYQFWSHVMALGVFYMTAGSISITAANGRRKSNYLSRISVAMMLHVICWVGTMHIIAVVVNLMTKSFFRDTIVPETACPYGGPNGEEERLYYILGGVTLGFIMICLILSSLCFTAFWKSPEWYEPAQVSRSGVNLSPVRPGPPRRENLYMAPNVTGGEVARGYWPTRPPTPDGYPTAKRDLSTEPDYSGFRGFNSSAQPGLSLGKSLRIVSADRQIRKTCVVASMRELLLVSKEKLRFSGDESLGICYDATGEEIEDEAAFQAIPDYSRLMVFSKTLDERWDSPKFPVRSGYENEGFMSDPPNYSYRSERPTVYQL